MTGINKNIKLILNYVAGPLLLCVLLYSINHQIRLQPDWENSIRRLTAHRGSDAVWSISLVVILMFVNWGIEARKWQVVMAGIQQLSWMQSFKATLTGTTLAFFTPNRMGEYLGRMLYVSSQNRVQAISLTIVGSMAQILVTFFFGASGIRIVGKAFSSGMSWAPSMALWIDTFFYAVVLVFAALALFYFRFSGLMRWVGKVPGTARLKATLGTLGNMKPGVLVHLLALSFIRYMVFMLQYYLLFRLFEVNLSPGQAFWSMSVVFLVMAIIPTIALFTELGVRWKTSIGVLQIFSPNIVGILATSLVIWMVNLVLPALLGSLLILNIRLFKYRSERDRPQPLKSQSDDEQP